MKYEIDVSGMDLFLEDYSICVANRDEKDPDNHLIKGFKFNKELQQTIIKNWKAGKYRYNENQRGLFKVRLYSIALYYIFKVLPKQEKVSLTICKDFHGHQNDINLNLNFLIENKLKTNIGKPRHQKLPKDSKAHWYAYLMSKDTANKLDTYVEISLEDFEEFLIKKIKK